MAIHLSEEGNSASRISRNFAELMIYFGAATLQKWRIKLDFEHDQVIVDPKDAKLQLI